MYKSFRYDYSAGESQNIGMSAISTCPNVNGELVIPQSVTSISAYPFHGSPFTVFSGIDNEYYTTVDEVLYDADMTNLIQYPAGKPDTSFIVPSGVESIDNYSFYGAESLTSITIPSSVTNIGAAFDGCSNLKTVIIESAAVAAMLSGSSSAGSLVRYASTVYVSESAASSLPAAFANMFSETTSVMTGYKKYVQA